MRCELTFCSGRTRHARGRSSGLEKLPRTQFLVGSIIDTPESSLSSFRKRQPHSGFSKLILRIRPRTSLAIRGRPPSGPDFHRQYAAKPIRCQRTMVCGRMIVMALRTDGNQRYSWMKNRRSLAVRERDPTAHLALQHNQLLPQRGVLCFKSALGLKERDSQVQEEDYQRGHRGRRYAFR
jgi:hypothetical protein